MLQLDRILGERGLRQQRYVEEGSCGDHVCANVLTELRRAKAGAEIEGRAPTARELSGQPHTPPFVAASRFE